MNILVVGKGGREHAIHAALAASPGDHRLYAFPGSDAISQLATCIEADGVSSLVTFMQENHIDLCIAGEEAYLVKDEGIANACEAAGIPCWGPHRQSAQLEASKEFAKQFMVRHGIPTGGYLSTSSAQEAVDAITSYPAVLKFDGLAAGKGVALPQNELEAREFIEEVLVQRKFGAGNLLVEEYLTGPEISIFAAVADGEYQILAPARDYKRIGEADAGPNTGGMGAVASRELADPGLLAEIENTIVQPTVEGLVADNLPYRGFLYFGIMLTPTGPKVLEYNCRFGDPECQAVLPLIEGDLASYCAAGAAGRIERNLLDFRAGWSVCVILASAGYPASSRSGDTIDGLERASRSARIYHAGTRLNAAGDFETAGGRVLAVVGYGKTREEAVSVAHLAADEVAFDGLQRRRDIGILHFSTST
jgi:phosphoribosylamine--glycine ligase